MDAYRLVLIAAMIPSASGLEAPQGTEQEVICFSCIGSDS